MIKLDHGIIRVSGADSTKFLQGIISNDIKKAEKGKAIYTFFLTPQGKYIADFFVINVGENEFLIDCALSDKDILLKKLSMYKLRSDIKITDETLHYDIYQTLELHKNPSVKESFSDPRNEKMGLRIITSKDFIQFHKSDIKIYHKLRINNLVPEGEFDMEKEKSFPLQFRAIENNGVDFKKGCYVGQEVTARTYHRGAVRKTIYKVSANENLEKLSCQNIISDDLEVGKLLTSIDNEALALIDIEAVESGNSLYINNIKLKFPAATLT